VSEISPYPDGELNKRALRLRCRDLRADLATARRGLDLARGLIARLDELNEHALESLAKVNEHHKARVAELEREVSVLGSDCHDGTCRACVKCCDAALERADRAEAQVASLREALEVVKEEREAGFGGTGTRTEGDIDRIINAALAAAEPKGGTT
jgi:hypothetical protein